VTARCFIEWDEPHRTQVISLVLTPPLSDLSRHRHILERSSGTRDCTAYCAEDKARAAAPSSFIPQSALRRVHSLFQSEFSTECDLLLSLSICSICSLGHPVAAYVFFLVFPSLLSFFFFFFNKCFRRQSLRKCDQPSLLLFLLLFVGSMSQWNTSSF
jgi:hypothetical protein